MRFFALFIAVFFSTAAIAATTDCPGHFANDEAPDIINQKLVTKTRDVCYSGYPKVALKEVAASLITNGGVLMIANTQLKKVLPMTCSGHETTGLIP